MRVPNFRYLIDVELKAPYVGPAPWRSYHLVSQGHFADDFVQNAVVVEFDKDGGELATYSFMKAPRAVLKESDKELQAAIWTVVQRDREKAQAVS